MNIEDIAEVCHEANRGLCLAQGDYTQQIWRHAPSWQKDSLIDAVDKHVISIDRTGFPILPSESHAAWMKRKLTEGWTLGAKKDVDEKKHPNLVPYDVLPDIEKAKDFVFGFIVAALHKHLDAGSA